MTTVLGIDIGGTHTRGRLVRDGKTLTECSVSSASLTAAGRPAAEAALAELAHQLRLDEHGPVDAVCVGSAGSGSTKAREFLTETLSPAVSPTGQVLVVNDARLALPSAGYDEGVAVIGGTGSIALGLADGREVRAGGWGYLLGDEGSGYWTVRAAVREVADRQDRGADLGELGAVLLAASGANDVAELVQQFYDRPNPDGWAAHAREVVSCPDPAAAEILEKAAGHLCALAVTAAERLAGRSDLPIVLAGGFLSGSSELAEAVRAKIESSLPEAPVAVTTEPPVAGAVRLAEAMVASG